MYIKYNIYIYIQYLLVYIYMSRGSYSVQNAIDGMFLPRSPIP